MKKAKLSQKKASRDRELRNQLSSLVLYGEIKTTQAKSKYLKREAEKLINLAKIKEKVTRVRTLDKILYGKALDFFETKQYQSVSSFKLENRCGDGAKISLVRLNEVKKIEKMPSAGVDKKTKSKK